MRRKFKVLKPLFIGVGSSTQNLAPQRYIKIAEGEIIFFDCRAPDGTMWFYYKGERGKIETNITINQFIEKGRLEEVLLY